MNLALLFDEDFVATDRAVLRGRRLAHLQSVLKVVAGDTLPVGRADGQLGTGEVIRLTDNEAELRVTLGQAPPAPLPLWVTRGNERMRNTRTGMCVGQVAAPVNARLGREAQPFRRVDEESNNAIS